MDPATTPHRPWPRWLTWAMLAVALARLVLVSHDEIRAFPYDESAYPLIAAAGYWGHDYLFDRFTRQPGYPLFLTVCSTLGVPVRLAIELLWIGAAAAVARVLPLLGLRHGASLLAFALLLAHPMPTREFSRLLADTLYTVALVAMLAGLLGAIRHAEPRGRRRWGVLAGLSAAVAGNTRPESILLWGLLAVAAVLAIASWVRTLAPRDIARRLVAPVMVPALMLVGVTLALKTLNYATIGAFVTTDLLLPGYRDLYRTLLAIPPDQPALRVPVPRDVRERAAEASPMFAELRRVMETDPRIKAYFDACRAQSGREGEFGAWTIWALRDAAFIVNQGAWRNAADADRYYARVAGELRAAMDAGRLPRRAVYHDFIPPEWGELARALPDSARATWRSLTTVVYTRTAHERTLPGDDVARINAMAMRRQALLGLQSGRAAPLVAWHTPGAVQRMDAVKSAIARSTHAATIVALALAALSVPAAVWATRRGMLGWAWWIAVLLLWAAVVSRLAMLVVMDAAGIDAQPRYAMPAAVLLAPLAVLHLNAIVRAVEALMRRPTARSSKTAARSSHA